MDPSIFFLPPNPTLTQGQTNISLLSSLQLLLLTKRKPQQFPYFPLSSFADSALSLHSVFTLFLSLNHICPGGGRAGKAAAHGGVVLGRGGTHEADPKACVRGRRQVEAVSDRSTRRRRLTVGEPVDGIPQGIRFENACCRCGRRHHSQVWKVFISFLI